VALAGSYGIAHAVQPLLDLVDCYDLLGRRRTLRLLALKALGDLADPAALPRLERFFRNWLIPLVALEERRAAFRSLQSYPAEARAPVAQRGLRSGDHEIRQVCARLRQDAPATPGLAASREVASEDAPASTEES